VAARTIAIERRTQVASAVVERTNTERVGAGSIPGNAQARAIIPVHHRPGAARVRASR
jgi:hypothetical protein